MGFILNYGPKENFVEIQSHCRSNSLTMFFESRTAMKALAKRQGWLMAGSGLKHYE
jgi:hypothetical protein